MDRVNGKEVVLRGGNIESSVKCVDKLGELNSAVFKIMALGPNERGSYHTIPETMDIKLMTEYLSNVQLDRGLGRYTTILSKSDQVVAGRQYRVKNKVPDYVIDAFSYT